MQSAISPQRVKSAYFSEEDSSRHPTDSSQTTHRYDGCIATLADQNQEVRMPVLSEDAHIPAAFFPSYRAVLWNRSNYGSPVVLSPVDVLPALRISPHSVAVLVEQLMLSHEERVSNLPVRSAAPTSSTRAPSDESVVLLGHLLSAGALGDQDAVSLEQRCGSSMASPERFILTLSSLSEEKQPYGEWNNIHAS